MVVYILHSDSIQEYYVGISQDLVDRLKRHNSGRSKATKKGVPWEVIRIIHCTTRSEAVILEKKIKKRGIQRWLLDNLSEEQPDIKSIEQYRVPPKAGRS